MKRRLSSHEPPTADQSRLSSRPTPPRRSPAIARTSRRTEVHGAERVEYWKKKKRKIMCRPAPSIPSDTVVTSRREDRRMGSPHWSVSIPSLSPRVQPISRRLSALVQNSTGGQDTCFQVKSSLKTASETKSKITFGLFNSVFFSINFIDTL